MALSIELLQADVTELKELVATLLKNVDDISHDTRTLNLLLSSSCITCKSKSEEEDPEREKNPYVILGEEGECEGKKNLNFTELAREVIAKWNSTVAKNRKWRKSRVTEADVTKVVAALRRKEFSNNWSKAIDLLDKFGLTFIGPDGRSKTGWKPNVRWLCRKETMSNIIDATYWPNIQDRLEGGES